MHRGAILCIVHQRTSYPGRLGKLFMERGFYLDVRCPHIGHALPETPEGYAATLMFGGPMSALDDHLPAIGQETRWLRKAVLHPIPFVGICLGAQILARALGAKVWHHEKDHVEIGYHTIRPTQKGLDHFDGPLQVFQWHKDGFDLPVGATLLAAGSKDFPNQCFRYGKYCFAVQFHPEVTYEMMCRWTVGGAHMLNRIGAMPRDEQLRLHPINDPLLGDWTKKFVNYIIELSEKAGACVKAA